MGGGEYMEVHCLRRVWTGSVHAIAFCGLNIISNTFLYAVIKKGKVFPLQAYGAQRVLGG
jgi:hypothetical protein